MLKSKKKKKKKELKQDKLVTWYFEVVEQVQKYQRELITCVIIAIVAVSLIFFLFIKPRQENAEIASTALGNICAFYDYKQYQMAMEGIPERNIIGLKGIVSDYGSTKAGEIAKIYLGNSYLAMGDYDNALKNYEDFGGSEKMFKVAALIGKATVYEAKGQYAEAASEFEKAATQAKDDIQTPEIYLNAAKNYGLSGNRTKAVELLEKIKLDYPTSTASRESDRYIAEYRD
jgi:tetratricopeptide (TPR) repeat protein